MSYNEQYGPQTSTYESTANQSVLFAELKEHYNLSDELTGGCDYFKIFTTDGVDYYTPNNEEWGSIIAVCEEHKVAVNTGFYEIDDIAQSHSDYKLLPVNGVLYSAFEVN